MSQSHKPNYSQVEIMDWEPSPPTSVVENSSSDKDWKSIQALILNKDVNFCCNSQAQPNLMEKLAIAIKGWQKISDAIIGHLGLQGGMRSLLLALKIIAWEIC
ncbi:hypothetical protein BY996DRAFT_6550494 [Phakopsora pachyrhizi]|nr:hypothetical protein BY996DRAFT_6550494 [Phakopsora pachyrhizi]